ncbi:MAG: diguanylate cyclase [Spirochaetota bacterium]
MFENAKNILYAIVVFFYLISNTAPIFTSPVKKEERRQFLSQSESQWLKDRKDPIKVGITPIPGQVIRGKKNSYSGFTIDLFRNLEDKIGTKFQLVAFNSWDDLIDSARRREIDVIDLAQKTQLRLTYFDFTDTVLSLQNKIITRTEIRNELSVDDLPGMSVAVSKGSAILEHLQIYFPKIKLIPTSNAKEALNLVENKKVDAAISGSVRASHYIKELNIKNLHIAGDLEYDYRLRIASRNDLPELNIILSKAASQISSDELQALYLKWGYVKDKETYFDKQTLIYIGIAFGIIIPFTIYLSFLNTHLRKEIIERKKALSELKIAHEEIHRLKSLAEKEARVDELTKILNKRGFKEILIEQMENFQQSNTGFCLLFLDIDFFKKVNDNMGHDVGDAVLQGFAQLIQENIQASDFFGRIGGEEFAIIFPNTSLKQGIKIAERLRKVIGSHTFAINEYNFQITSSLGITEIVKNDSFISLYKRVDTLLYQSKENGRNMVSSVFNESITNN